jgi:Cdc6-like AAA superfamily ATPase
VAGKTANQKKLLKAKASQALKKAPKASGTTNFTAVSSESENASEGSPVSTEMRTAVGSQNKTLANKALSHPRAQNANPRAQTADEVLNDTKEELRITNEELGITKDKLNNLTTKYGDQSKDLKTVHAKLSESQKTLKETEKELDSWIEDHDKLKHINEKLEDELAAKSGDGGGDNTMYPIDNSVVRNVKVAVQKVFRLIKFVSNDAQLEAFGERVMDNLGLHELKLPDAAGAPDAKIVAKVRKNCMRFCNMYWKIWNRFLNENRTTSQVFDLLLNILTKTSKIISLTLVSWHVSLIILGRVETCDV